MGLILVKSKEDVCKERAEFECNVLFQTKLKVLRDLGKSHFKDFIALTYRRQDMFRKIYEYHMNNYEAAADMYVDKEDARVFGRFQKDIPRSPFLSGDGEK